MDIEKKYKIILGISVTLLLIAIIWPIGKTPKAQPEKNIILGILQEQSDIASTEVTIRKMGIYNSETKIASLNPTKWKLGKRVCAVPVDVTIRYGIDLSKITENDLEFVGDDTIRIKLPEPTIIDKSYNPITNHDEIVSFATGMRDEVGESTIQQIKEMAFNDVINQNTEIQEQLSRELIHNSEAVFTSLLSAIGLTPVFIH